MLTVARVCALLFFVTITLSASGQVEDADTVDIKPFERYWTKPRIVPKVGFGVQETGFGEIGIEYHKIYIHPLSLASAGPYLTVDGVFQPDEIILGPKAGYEVTAGLLGLAADVTYYTDFDREVVMITPKAGLTLFGYANLFYGRNFNLSDDHFRSISPNRFSLIFNLNKDYHNIRSATKQQPKAKAGESKKRRVTG
jgi:hypothetical protein